MLIPLKNKQKKNYYYFLLRLSENSLTPLMTASVNDYTETETLLQGCVQKITNIDFNRFTKVVEGSFGCVYKGTYNNTDVAIKKFKNNGQSVLNEALLMRY